MNGRTEGGICEWSVISAVNTEEVLASCLAASPGLQPATEVLLQRGFSGAAGAYNDAIITAKTDLLAFVHQDVYLPEGWIDHVRDAIRTLNRTDPRWGVLGVWGPRPTRGRAGFVYNGAGRNIHGKAFEGGIEVESLDEAVLILRKSSGLRFDPAIPGFHMYGADICQQAKQQGMKNYAIAAFCIHNTNEHGMLPWQFWQGYLAMRRKWKAQLPIKTTCTEITRWCWPMIRWNVVRAINLATGREKTPNRRVEDPGKLYRELVSSGVVSSSVRPGRGGAPGPGLHASNRCKPRAKANGLSSWR